MILVYKYTVETDIQDDLFSTICPCHKFFIYKYIIKQVVNMNFAAFRGCDITITCCIR